MTTTTIDLMRHGEPVGGRKYRGQNDDALSEKGWRQMWQAVGDFAGWQHIVSSPLSRCAAFSAALGEQRHIPVKRDARLAEVGFGAWEGRTPQQLEQAEPGILQRFKRDPVGLRPEGAEALDAFFARVSQAWLDILREHSGQHVLVVCHAGVIRMALAQVLGMPPENVYRMQIASAAVTRIVVQGEGDAAFATLMLQGGVASGAGGGD
jgi:alpha-ribazole phosphatase/probable phosphoglycerate mutase